MKCSAQWWLRVYISSWILVPVSSKYSQCIYPCRKPHKDCIFFPFIPQNSPITWLESSFHYVKLFMPVHIYFNSQKFPLMRTVSLHCFSLKESCFNVLSYSDVALLELSIYFQISFTKQVFTERQQHALSCKKLKSVMLNRSLPPTYNTYLKSLQVFNGHDPCSCKIDIDLVFPTVLSIN